MVTNGKGRKFWGHQRLMTLRILESIHASHTKTHTHQGQWQWLSRHHFNYTVRTSPTLINKYAVLIMQVRATSLLAAPVASVPTAKYHFMPRIHCLWTAPVSRRIFTCATAFYISTGRKEQLEVFGHDHFLECLDVVIDADSTTRSISLLLYIFST